MWGARYGSYRASRPPSQVATGRRTSCCSSCSGTWTRSIPGKKRTTSGVETQTRAARMEPGVLVFRSRGGTRSGPRTLRPVLPEPPPSGVSLFPCRHQWKTNTKVAGVLCPFRPRVPPQRFPVSQTNAHDSSVEPRPSRLHDTRHATTGDAVRGTTNSLRTVHALPDVLTSPPTAFTCKDPMDTAPPPVTPNPPQPTDERSGVETREEPEPPGTCSSSDVDPRRFASHFGGSTRTDRRSGLVGV